MPPSAKIAGGSLAAAIAMIISAVVAIEGGFVDHPSDPGGATKFGVTEREARANGYAGEMRALTREQAELIYEIRYVRKPGFGQLVARSVALGEEVIDQGVNMGPHRPSCWLQQSINSLNRGGRDYPDVKVDCQVGRQTLAAFDALARRRGNSKACELVLKLMEAQQGSEYLRLSQVNGKLEDFMAGWIDHRIGNVPLARCAEGGAG